MNWKREFKRELFEQFARVGKTLGSGLRLELIEHLSQAERTVEDLADLTDTPVANTSQHLQVLRHAQLVEVRRHGLYAFYRLADESVFRLWQAIRTVGEKRIGDIERVVNLYLKDRKNLEPITVKELSMRLREGSAVVIDVRPTAEFAAGHIPGALSVPVNELKRRMDELPTGEEIVAYCRGPYCVQSDEAVALLKQHGFKVRRLEVGLPDWRTKGLPVVTERESKSPQSSRKSSRRRSRR